MPDTSFHAPAPIDASVPDPLPWQPKRSRRSLFAALLQARRDFGGGRTALSDADGRELTYTELVRAALALGHKLKDYSKKGEIVGVFLPTGAAATLAVYGLSAYGRVPAMLNFTAGERGLKAALKMAEIKTVVTAHKFIDLGGYEDIADSLAEHARLVYLEDEREALGMRQKANALVGSIAPSLVASRADPDAEAVVLFTSGTEGDPKGVVLSHANILANVEQVRSLVGLDPDRDSVFNPLPVFHSFGLTVGTVLPLVAGVRLITHPSPLQPREIAKRIEKEQATILLATDTFISQYARAGGDQSLTSVRLAVCGAERVRDETRAMVRRKYGIEILEGYGATEAAPVIAANSVEMNRPGSVGKPLHDVQIELLPVEGLKDGGRLRVRGPNVMKGYLRTSAPGVIERPLDGWHDTGDIVAVEADGTMRIKGRVKRFAKIGGEMVSLTVVENCAGAIWTDCNHAAAALPDSRKGEQIILLSEAPECNRQDILGWAQSHGVPEISVPKKIFHVAEIPMLGTGKVDYGKVNRMAAELTSG